MSHVICLMLSSHRFIPLKVLSLFVPANRRCSHMRIASSSEQAFLGMEALKRYPQISTVTDFLFTFSAGCTLGSSLSSPLCVSEALLAVAFQGTFLAYAPTSSIVDDLSQEPTKRFLSESAGPVRLTLAAAQRFSSSFLTTLHPFAFSPCVLSRLG